MKKKTKAIKIIPPNILFFFIVFLYVVECAAVILFCITQFTQYPTQNKIFSYLKINIDCLLFLSLIDRTHIFCDKFYFLFLTKFNILLLNLTLAHLSSHTHRFIQSQTKILFLLLLLLKKCTTKRAHFFLLFVVEF